MKKRIALIAFMMIILSACSKVPKERATQKEFNKLDKGMSYEEVVKVIGGEPTEYEIRGKKAVKHYYRDDTYACRWQGNNGEESFLEVVFYNDKLQAKNTNNLK